MRKEPVNQLSKLQPERWLLSTRKECSNTSNVEKGVLEIASSVPLQVSKQKPGDHLSDVMYNGFCVSG